MSFMQAQITKKTKWVRVTSTHDEMYDVSADECFRGQVSLGVHFEDGEQKISDPGLTPEDVLAFTEVPLATQIKSVEVIEGYGVRASAPGYMDRTDWEVFDTVKAAEKRYRELRRELRGED